MRPLKQFGRIIAVLLVASVVTAVLAAAFTQHTVQLVQANTSAAPEVQVYELALASSVYAADGTYLGNLHGEQNRIEVSLSEISDKTIKAILAVEDADFYEHNGINARAITRALIENVSAGTIQQGGSTITQQLVKLIVTGDRRQEADRKITEAVLALRLERQMSKDEILERYLNAVYFGGGAYGVQAAARMYFAKNASELDWAESALLAAVIRNPVRYDPTRNPEIAEARRRIALERMADEGLITAEEVFEYASAPLPTTRNVEDKAPEDYFLEEVKLRLLDDPRLGETKGERIEKLFAGGLQVYTTLDLQAQAAAERAIAEVLAPVRDDPRNFTAAMVALEPGTGYVRALVGGPGFDQFRFNIATQKGRPTGSSFKAFVLAAALEAGYVPNDTISGSSPCRFPNPGGDPDPYVAENFGGSGGGGGTITSQTLRSSNCAFLRLAQVVGLPNVVATAKALGVSSKLDDNGAIPLSLPLGPKDITPLDMATAYAAFANDGLRVDPVFVTKVVDRHGNVVLENTPNPTRAVSTQTARLITDVLRQNVEKGTGTRARLPNQVAAGKTGTAQNFQDAWFVGYTPYLSTAVWMGNPEGSVEMRNVGGVGSVTGGSFPARIWGQFNRDYHAGLEPKDFAEPERTRPGKALRTPEEEERARSRPSTTRPADEQPAAPGTDAEAPGGENGAPAGEPPGAAGAPAAPAALPAPTPAPG